MCILKQHPHNNPAAPSFACQLCAARRRIYRASCDDINKSQYYARGIFVCVWLWLQNEHIVHTDISKDKFQASTAYILRKDSSIDKKRININEKAALEYMRIWMIIIATISEQKMLSKFEQYYRYVGYFYINELVLISKNKRRFFHSFFKSIIHFRMYSIWSCPNGVFMLPISSVFMRETYYSSWSFSIWCTYLKCNFD